MDSARISALLEPFLGPPGDRRLSAGDVEQISTYIDLLLRWNARINLTSIRDPEEIVTRHFGESFFLARHLFPAPRAESEPDHSKLAAPGSKRVIDIGSGAGFPALPVKIWAPQIHLTMIESNHKKAAFLREAARALTLTNVNVIAERAEVVAAAFAPADVVTFRAVEKFHQVLPLATRFLSPGATMAILITESQQAQLQTIRSLTWTITHIPQSHQQILALGKY